MSNSIRLLIFGFVCLKIGLHLAANHQYGFHADELYYIALTKHLQWGYLDVSPFIAFVAAASRFVLGNSLFAYRLVPTLISGLTIAVVGYAAYYLNGKKLAITIACLAMICSPAYLATSYFLQPVVFEHFFWSLLALLFIRYRQRQSAALLYLAAIVLSFGILNKYTMLLYAFALFPVFIKPKKLVGPAALCLIILLPNIVWQLQHNLPIVHYIGVVRSNTGIITFGEALFQFTFFHGAGMAVWLAGLGYLLFSPQHVNYRFVAWAFLVTTVVFFLLKGKIYYGLGAFPVLFAAGGVCWEKMLEKRVAFWRYSFGATLVLTALIALPSVIPVLPYQHTLQYFKLMRTYTSITAIFKWEDGKVHHIPQTYADMLGWQELAGHVAQAISDDKDLLVYTDDYGIAGAISYYLPNAKVVSPNSSFALWSPQVLHGAKVLYVTKQPVKHGVQIANKAFVLYGPSKQFKENYIKQLTGFKGTGHRLFGTIIAL